MNNTISKLLSKTEEELQILAVEIEDPIKFSETAINVLLKSLEQLKSLVIKTNFKNQLDEIKFFKVMRKVLIPHRPQNFKNSKVI